MLRGETRFSIRAAAAALVIIVAGYFLVNSLYARMVGIPPGSAFGNFSYALYGQVRGGTGWHSAIEELGTRSPSAVYHAALQFFLEHPVSLFIGFAKAYRDFFLPGDPGIFPFGQFRWQNWPNLALWAGMLLLLLCGLLKLLKTMHLHRSALLAASFLGIFLSIPFLPPVDGGARFYASTMPFFFILPAFGLSRLGKRFEPPAASTKDWHLGPLSSRSLAIVLLTLTLLAPVVTYLLGQQPAYPVPACPSELRPFVIQVYRNSYIDLVKDGASRCGFVPEVCLHDFEANNVEKSVDDYYQHLLLVVQRAEETVRIVPAIDWVQEKFHYFYFPKDKIQQASSDILSGCATEVDTKNQSIYQVEQLSPATK
jgi:hypothetical protein